MNQSETSDDATTMLVGGGADVAGPAQEAVHAEVAVSERPAELGQDTAIAGWLFCPSQDAKQFPLTQLRDIVNHDENLAWVDVCNYSEEQVHWLAAQLDLSDAEIQAAFSSWQRPRLNVHGEHFFVSVTVARLDIDARQVHAAELNLYAGHNYLLSVHKLPLPFADRILTRAQQSPELVRLDSAFMLSIVLDELLAYYESLAEVVQGDIEHMEERALTETSDTFLSDLVAFKRYVAALNRLAEQHRPVFGVFLRPDFRFTGGEELAIYFRDLEARLSRLIDTLQEARDSVNGAFEIYVSHVSHRTNQIIKVLTIVSTILLPVSVIVGLFATSFRDVPLYNPVGFIAMLLAIVAVTTGILLTFQRRGWL